MAQQKPPTPIRFQTEEQLRMVKAAAALKGHSLNYYITQAAIHQAALDLASKEEGNAQGSRS